MLDSTLWAVVRNDIWVTNGEYLVRDMRGGRGVAGYDKTHYERRLVLLLRTQMLYQARSVGFSSILYFQSGAWSVFLMGW